MGNGASAGTVSSDGHAIGEQAILHDEPIANGTDGRKEIAAASASQEIVDDKDDPKAAANVHSAGTAEEDSDTGKRTISALMEEWLVLPKN